MNIRNPIYNQDGDIDCELEHPQLGWIPFTASPDDAEELGRALFIEIKASGGEIAPYVPPSPEELLAHERGTMVVSTLQVKLALAEAGHLENAETYIETASLTAQITWREARDMRRLSPLVIELGSALGLTETQLDELFRRAATIEV